MPSPPAWVTAAASLPPAAEPIGASRMGCWMPSSRVSAVSIVAMCPPADYCAGSGGDLRVGRARTSRTGKSIGEARIMATGREHAVVLGGSMAGLGTARALSNHFERVTLVERDELAARS